MIEDILKKEYENAISNANSVLSIFSEFYGEDKVELQGLSSLEDFLEYFNQSNVLRYAYLNISFTTEQQKFYSSIYNDGKYTDEEIQAMDLSFNNEEIFDLFYDSYAKSIFTKVCIMVYFPMVTITNENGKSIDIHKVFVKVPITKEGYFNGGNMYFNRAEYTKAQLANQYMHSHISSYDYDRMSNFLSSCLGEGPIRGTIAKLNIDNDPLLWQLYCLELKNYLETESIAGGPYKHLSGINNKNFKDIKKNLKFTNGEEQDTFLRNHHKVINDFMIYFLSKNLLSFNYVDGSYAISLSFIDFSILLSNEFINWYNSIDDQYKIHNNIYRTRAINNGLIFRGYVINNREIGKDSDFFNGDRFENIINKVQNQIACTFKGVEQKIVISDSQETDYSLIILNYTIIDYIFTQITSFININYGRNIANTTEETSNGIQRNTKTLYFNN